MAEGTSELLKHFPPSVLCSLWLLVVLVVTCETHKKVGIMRSDTELRQQTGNSQGRATQKSDELQHF